MHEGGVVVDRDKRDELARFLRSRRRRLTPAEVGLPTGERRRTAGLRREEVAILAGVSPTWYTYLEQGRSIHPSREVMESLAAVLRFSEDERIYARTLVEGSYAPPLDAIDPKPTVGLLCEVVEQYQTSPYPVYAVDHRCDLLAWNAAMREWYDDFDAMPPEHHNLLRWLLASPVARERMVDWADVTQESIARWRAESAHHPYRQIEDRVDEFSELNPKFRDWWNNHEVMDHRAAIRRIRHPEHGVTVMRILPLFAPEVRVAGLIFHVPA